MFLCFSCCFVCICELALKLIYIRAKLSAVYIQRMQIDMIPATIRALSEILPKLRSLFTCSTVSYCSFFTLLAFFLFFFRLLAYVFRIQFFLHIFRFIFLIFSFTPEFSIFFSQLNYVSSKFCVYFSILSLWGSLCISVTHSSILV